MFSSFNYESWFIMVIVICFSNFHNDVGMVRKSAKFYNHLEKHGYKYEIVVKSNHLPTSTTKQFY
jgi:hypothetical protein